MRKRIYIYIFVAATFVLGVIGYLIFAPRPVWVSTSSPSRTYTVELSRSFIPLFEQIVRFNLYRNDQSIVKATYLISFDYFDSGFGEMYGNHGWVNESVLRFTSHTSDREKRLDSLVVTNKTNKTVKYLIVGALDLFLIFDIEPNSRIKLTATHSKWQSYITGEGEFANGERIVQNSVNYSHEGKFQAPLRYCISINDDGLKIESPMMEGWKIGKPNTPVSANCDE